MTDVRYTPGSFHAPIAVFPLPEVVLFPGALLPLHIFEPRYRKMTDDVLAGTHELCVALIVDPAPRDVHGHPALPAVAGLGHVVRHERLPDGRFHLLLRGMARARVEELPFDPPYRRVKALVLGDEIEVVSPAAVTLLRTLATRVVAAARRAGDRRELSLPDGAEPGVLADLCAAQCLTAAEERQALLAELNVARRVQHCTELLATQEARSDNSRTLN